jgi:hypothetical protein
MSIGDARQAKKSHPQLATEWPRDTTRQWNGGCKRKRVKGNRSTTHYSILFSEEEFSSFDILMRKRILFFVLTA